MVSRRIVAIARTIIIQLFLMYSINSGQSWKVFCVFFFPEKKPEKKTQNRYVKKEIPGKHTFNSVQNEYTRPKQVVWWWYGLSQHLSVIRKWISCLEQSRRWCFEWLDPNFLDCQSFRIHTEKTISNIEQRQKASGTWIFIFVQGIVGYSAGRVNWYLCSAIQQFAAQGEKGSWPLWNPV